MTTAVQRHEGRAGIPRDGGLVAECHVDGRAQVVLQRFFATGAEMPGHFVRPDLGNQRAGAGVDARVVAAGVEGEDIDAVGEQRMVDGVGPVAVEAVDALDVEVHRDIRVEALHVVVEALA